MRLLTVVGLASGGRKDFMRHVPLMVALEEGKANSLTAAERFQVFKSMGPWSQVEKGWKPPPKITPEEAREVGRQIKERLTQQKQGTKK